MTPRLLEAHFKAWDVLAAKVSYSHARSKGTEYEEDHDDGEHLEVDVLSSPHAILHESNLSKKSEYKLQLFYLHYNAYLFSCCCTGHNSMVGHLSKRHVILLNDALLITKIASSGILKSSESFLINQSFRLDKISIRDMANFGDESKLAFEVITSKRPYTFLAESESEKRIWLEELTLGIYAVHMTSPMPPPPGWQHLAVRGTIYSAALMGDLETFMLQLGKVGESAIDSLDSSGMSSLHWAAFGGNQDIVQVILEHGGDPDILNSGLNSPLHVAASAGQSAAVQTLLDFRADLSLRNMKDRDAMFMAVLYCRREKLLENVLKLFFVKGVDLNRFDSAGATPLHECAERGLSRAIKYLVDEEADVNLPHDVSGLTPLQIASCSRFPHAETVRALIENGAHMNQKNKNGKTPFESVLETYVASLGDAAYDREKVVESVLATLQELAKAGARFNEEDLKPLRASFKDAILSSKQAWVDLEPPDYFADYSIAGSLAIEKDVIYEIL